MPNAASQTLNAPIATGTSTKAATKAPLIWLILGDKGGDNGQVEVIAQALPWPSVRKFVKMKDEFVLGKPKFGASLHHIDLAGSDPLTAPWPDLIITVGRRPSMAALWVRAQAARETDKPVKILLVGKPTKSMLDFDLIVASAENHLPPLPNYFPLRFPLMRIDQQQILGATLQWQTRLETLPKPLIAILIGGATKPFVMDASVARRLAKEARRITEQLGGTPYLTTSRRTKPEVVSALKAALPEGAIFYEWQAGASDNPYRALLGTADGFVVTGDSISMMTEVLRLGKPLAIFSLPKGLVGSLDQMRRVSIRTLFKPRTETATGRLWMRALAGLYAGGWLNALRSTRDYTHFHQTLVKAGAAVWCGQAFQTSNKQLPDEDLRLLVMRIRELLDQKQSITHE